MIDSVFEHALDGVVAVDDALVIVGWNPAAERMLGYTRAEVLGRPVSEVMVPPARRQPFGEWVERQRVGGDVPFLGRTLLRNALCKDGSELPVEIRIADVRSATADGRSEVEAYVAFFQPTEEAYDRAEYRFRAFVEHASDMILCLDADGRLLYASPPTERITGHRPEDFVGTIPTQLFHPDSLPLALESLALTAATPGLKLPVELTVWHADGSTRQLEFLANNLLDDPDVRGDRHQRPRRHRAPRRGGGAARSAERMAALLQQLRRGIVLLSEEHEVVLVNQTFCDLFWFDEDPDSLIGLTVGDLGARMLPLVDDPGFYKISRRAIVEREPFADLVVFLVDGRIVESTMVIIESDHGPLGSLWIYEDVTERAIVAQTLADQNAQLQEIDQMRADWLATAFARAAHADHRDRRRRRAAGRRRDRRSAGTHRRHPPQHRTYLEDRRRPAHDLGAGPRRRRARASTGRHPVALRPRRRDRRARRAAPQRSPSR